MIYAKYIDEIDSTGARFTAMPSYPEPPDDTYIAYNVPDATWLYIANGAIAVYTQAEMDAAQLSVAQGAQIRLLAAAYSAAIQQPVSYTSKGGVVETYQANTASQINLASMLSVFTAQSATPTGFYWVAQDNVQVPFDFADLQGLAAIIGAQGWAAFQHLQTQKAAVLAALTVTECLAIIW